MQNTIIKSIVSLGLSCLSLSVLAAAAPQQPVDKNQCFGCHATAIKTLSTRGAHKNVNCVSCHDISPEHVKAPSRDNRPPTHSSVISPVTTLSGTSSSVCRVSIPAL